MIHGFSPSIIITTNLNELIQQRNYILTKGANQFKETDIIHIYHKTPVHYYRSSLVRLCHSCSRCTSKKFSWLCCPARKFELETTVTQVQVARFLPRENHGRGINFCHRIIIFFCHTHNPSNHNKYRHLHISCTYKVCLLLQQAQQSSCNSI